MSAISKPVSDVVDMARPVLDFFLTSRYAERRFVEGISDFVAGNPHEMPIPGLADAFQKWAVPQDKDWFAYKLSESRSRQVVADTAGEQLGIDFDPEDVMLTTGAFGALACSLRALVDEHDEVIFVSPRWFFYREMIRMAGANSIQTKALPDTWDLDLDAISRSITPKTRAVIVNSPNNPTGRIYPGETLSRLAEILQEASERNKRTIYLISDESYRKILFDDREFVTPAKFYPSTIVIYTFGKTLLAPGQRIGYIALPPTMPDRQQIVLGITAAQMTMGWAFPNALLQHAIEDLERLSIDIKHLQAKRDRMVDALQSMGYELRPPEGTFYLLPKSPLEDDLAFTDLLCEQDVYVLPGSISDAPGYFRISLTANDEMIERSFPAFEIAINKSK